MGAARQGQAPVFLYASHKKGRQTGTSLYLTCKSGIYAVLKLYFGGRTEGVFMGLWSFLWLDEVS